MIASSSDYALLIARYLYRCKFQSAQGTTDEKVPYALDDIKALPIPGCLVYAGTGWSPGVLHLLRSSPRAAYCFPGGALTPGETTRELDQRLAMSFGWWDILTAGQRAFAEEWMERLDLGA